MGANENIENLAGVRKPAWLRKRVEFSALGAVKEGLRRRGLSTVCESAKCPNIGECFKRNTATFLILGENCSRRCSFCAVKSGVLAPPDPAEPLRVAEMAREMGLKYVVVTSVTRDDLPDQGAGHYAQTVRAVRSKNPSAQIELLTPDFNGDKKLIGVVLNERPDVFNHNVETVPSLYPRVRPRGDFKRSLEVLSFASESGATVKSGIMVGLGETEDELVRTMTAVRSAGARILTVGQYLAPSLRHAPVAKYYTEEFFVMIAEVGKKIGFDKVFSGPLVRSSYMADAI